MRCIVQAVVAVMLANSSLVLAADEKPGEQAWRKLPLITDGQVDKSWTQVGWGRYVVDGDALRSECDEKGLGLLLYRPEKFGDCQIRVVFKAKDAKANAGVFVRIDDGIVDRLQPMATAVKRDAQGKLSKEMLQQLREAADRKEGPWYAVHHGYEVQICDDADAYHRTGAIYSLAQAAPVDKPATGEWRTLEITLQGNLVLVDVDGQRVTTFDPESRDVPAQKEWYEPSREAKRPRTGYIGLQTHDPRDVVWIKEVSVRPLGK